MYDDHAISGETPPPPPRPCSATPLSPLHAGHTHQDSLDTPTRLLCSLARKIKILIDLNFNSQFREM